ncbi:MAG: hypothetical protein Q8R06_20495 [Polaromonas sp.]|uniref:hypothetical protein n=1 Tax=Polaromonas sp. TaxID=1869339 RepID=UPI0027360DA6|nr:hypothetical protein [Polaromonas sp.]MDP3799491.1 hypothetical protein [Polaromonas sp.]
MGQSATHPIEPPWRVLAALLLLAGRRLPRRLALPVHPMAAHSGASNCGFQVETSQAEVRKITLHQMHLARQAGSSTPR